MWFCSNLGTNPEYMKKERFNYRWKKQTKKSKHHPQKGFPNCRRKESGETLNNGGKTMGG